METTLSIAELEHDLAAALERVRGGERVVVVRDGEPIAVIAPPPNPAARPIGTWRELAERLRTVPPPDGEFAADLEEIQATQPPMQIIEWSD